MIVLDTNVVSEAIRTQPDGTVAAWLAARPSSSLFITTVTQAELLYGIRLLPDGKRRDGLTDAIRTILRDGFQGRVLAVDGPAAEASATIAAGRRTHGRPISASDAQIAAIARSRGAGVATRNVADFDGCGSSTRGRAPEPTHQPGGAGPTTVLAAATPAAHAPRTDLVDASPTARSWLPAQVGDGSADTTGMGDRWRQWTFTVGGVTLLTAYLLASSPWWRWLLYQAVLYATAAAVLLAVRRHRPSGTLAWLLLAGGVVLLGVSVTLDPGFAGTAGRRGLVADLFSASGYPLIGIGALLFSRAQSSGRDRGPFIDSIVVTVALTVAQWELTMDRVVGTADDRIATMVMTFGATFVAAMTLRFMLAGGWRALSGRLIGACSIAGALGSATFAWYGFPDGRPADITILLWGIGLILLGLAALHPSMRLLTEPADVANAHLVARTVLPATAILALPVVALGRQLGGAPVSTITLAAMTIVSLLVVVRYIDLVAQRHRAATEAAGQALRDPLTRLPNRRAVLDQLAGALDQWRRQGGCVALCYLDLDGFKGVNDRFGHQAGDELLQSVADRLRGGSRSHETVARIGGDEFLVLVTADEQPPLDRVVARLRDLLTEPFALRVGEVSIGVSIGVAVAGEEAENAESLLAAADQAMYTDKRRVAPVATTT